MPEDNELTSYKIQVIADAIKRVECTVTEIRQMQTQDKEKFQNQIEQVKTHFAKEISLVKEEQEKQTLDYAKFKTKVLTWAAAGSAAGGLLIQLVK